MSVIVFWDNDEKTILRYHFSGRWTWDEYLESLQSGRKMMASVSHYVCILNDMHETLFLPPNFVTLAKNVIESRPDNTGLAIFYTSSQFFKAMYRVLENLLPEVPTNYLIATTEEDAYDRLNTWLAKNSMSSQR
ncbi:MAG: hypothetical protein RLP44_03560 [Aggregatilineales bacterium]